MVSPDVYGPPSFIVAVDLTPSFLNTKSATTLAWIASFWAVRKKNGLRNCEFVSLAEVADADTSRTPLFPRMVSATPSAALEQLVPITATTDESAASFVAAVWPPAFPHWPDVGSVSSWGVRLTGCPRSWPFFPSKVPSR